MLLNQGILDVLLVAPLKYYGLKTNMILIGRDLCKYYLTLPNGNKFKHFYLVVVLFMSKLNLMRVPATTRIEMLLLSVLLENTNIMGNGN